MKKLSVLCVVLSLGLSLGLSTADAFARGGMGSSHMSVTGGALGTSAAAPGTNSLGTALSSSGAGRPMEGPLLGTDPAAVFRFVCSWDAGAISRYWLWHQLNELWQERLADAEAVQELLQPSVVGSKS